ncbi:Interferon-inducible double-stranded RNA-dependent protein kinase activator A -like protein [Halotydeus destructor]|nr:Interferon-inducible double-stranded RNA-dependent protein kinase activator A -like protein [Halotydeus destructor]
MSGRTPKVRLDLGPIKRSHVKQESATVTRSEPSEIEAILNDNNQELLNLFYRPPSEFFVKSSETYHNHAMSGSVNFDFDHSADRAESVNDIHDTDVPATFKINPAPRVVESKNPISHLQEMCVASGCAMPCYEDVDQRGPSHARTFCVKASAAGLSATGSGNSKKVAKTEAARNLMKQLQNGVSENGASPLRTESHAVNRKPAEIVTLPSSKTQIPESVIDGMASLSLSRENDQLNANAVQMVIQFCQKHNLTPPNYQVEDESGEPHRPLFTMSGEIPEVSLRSFAQAGNKQAAKRECALDLLRKLNGLQVSAVEPQLPDGQLTCSNLVKHQAVQQLPNSTNESTDSPEAVTNSSFHVNSMDESRYSLMSNPMTNSPSKQNGVHMSEIQRRAWFFEAVGQRSVAKDEQALRIRLKCSSVDQRELLEEITRNCGGSVNIVLSDSEAEAGKLKFTCILSIMSQGVHVMSTFASSLESREKACELAVQRALCCLSLHSQGSSSQ